MDDLDLCEAAVRLRREADVLAFVLMCVFALSALTLSLLPVATAELQQRYGFSASQIGLLTSVFMLTYGSVAIPAGLAASRWGGWVLAGTCSCMVAGSLLFAFSSSFAGLLVARAVQGLGCGTVVVVSVSVMARLPRGLMDRASGIFGCGWGVGTVAALLLMPGVQAAYGYRGTFLVSGTLALVFGAWALTRRRVRALPDRAGEAVAPRGLGRSVRSVLTNRRMLLVGLMNLAALAIIVGILAWTPSFMRAEFGTALGASVYWTAGLGVAQIVANPLGAVASARLGKLPIVIVSMSLMTAFAAIVPLAMSPAVVFAFVLVVGFFSTFYFPAQLTLIPEVVRPEEVGPGSGVNTMMGFGGSLVAPWVFGLLLDAGAGFTAGYLTLAAFGGVGVAGVVLFWGRRR